MSIPNEIRREKCQLGRIIPCDDAYGQGAFWGSDEIKGWYPIEWAILGKPFLAKGIVPQQPWDIWDERCISLHWDPGGRPYEGWIQCLHMGLLGSLQDAPCVDTTQGSGGCILSSAILTLIWDHGIIVTDSLVISRGCFQEVSCDGTSFTSGIVTLLIGGFHGISYEGTVQCFEKRVLQIS